jgi:hypothetical protein
METTEREQLLVQYGDGYRVVAEALAGIDEEELDARSAPGRWSPREIIHHLADTEMIGAVRVRLLLAEDRPVITAVDQDRLVERLHTGRAHEASLELFRYARECTVQLLACLTPEEWLREGTHTELGPYSVERWLQTYADHAHKHARQIRQARDAAAHRS